LADNIVYQSGGVSVRGANLVNSLPDLGLRKASRGKLAQYTKPA
jgi:hypothetical protein